MEIVFGVPLGSILGPLLLKIVFTDLLIIIRHIHIAIYADYNTPYLLLIILIIL